MNVISSFVHFVSFSWNSSAATFFANSSTVCWTLLSSNFVTVSEIVESPSYFHKSVPGMLRSQWDPSWKRPPTPGKSQLPGESTYDLGPVQMHPFLFEKENIFLLFGLPTTRIRWKRSVQTHLSRNAIQSRYFWKHRLLVYVDGRKKGLSNTTFFTGIYACSVRVDGRKQFSYATYERVFFFETKQKISVVKNIRIRGTSI